MPGTHGSMLLPEKEDSDSNNPSAAVSSHICLHIRYGPSCTDVACGTAYSATMRCPVLTWRIGIPGFRPFRAEALGRVHKRPRPGPQQLMPTP
eukprot:1589379-Rhodomonas_salina.2